MRRLLDGPHPAVPPDLCAEALHRGSRRARRRALGRRLLWLLLGAALVAFLIWATLTQPPPDTTPPLGW